MPEIEMPTEQKTSMLDLLHQHKYSLECLVKNDVTNHLLKQTNDMIELSEFDIMDGMNDVNGIMELNQTIQYLADKMKIQELQIRELKQEKHKLRQEKALLKKIANP